MAKRTKSWLIAAGSLILVGCILFAGVMTALDWDFKKLSTNQYEAHTYAVTDDFANIAILGDSVADVIFVLSEDDTVSVVCHEQKNLTHSVLVKEGTLTVKAVDTRKWYHHIGITFGSPKITVYLPEGTYGNLTVETSTGDVNVPKDFSFASAEIATSTGDVTCSASIAETAKIAVSTGQICLADLSAGELKLTTSTGDIRISSVVCDGNIYTDVSTGKVHLSHVTCRNLTSEGDTGDLTLDHVIAQGSMDVERDTGDVVFDGCDAAEITVTTDTGDVSGTLLSDKIFMAHTDTGRVVVPTSTAGGLCEIHTDTGDISLKISD